jgi:hypothetical protein
LKANAKRSNKATQTCNNKHKEASFYSRTNNNPYEATQLERTVRKTKRPQKPMAIEYK